MQEEKPADPTREQETERVVTNLNTAGLGAGGWGVARAGQPNWMVLHEADSAEALLGGAAIEPARRLVRVCAVDGPAIVLGSTQPLSDIVERPEVPVVRRRSGGGAVWVSPGDPVWVDVVVPSGDPLAQSDVGRAFFWLGDAWAAALTDLGVADLEVHRGPLIRTPLSAVVCFAGLGPGEVRAGGRKVVGLAQRRTRAGALFQCAVVLWWDPAPLVSALAMTTDDRLDAEAALEATVTGIGDLDAEEVVAAFLRHLP